MGPEVYATEGWLWIRAAKRRLEDHARPATGPIDETDRTADIGQAVEAIDRALRYGKRVTEGRRGAVLPPGVDWDRVRTFARRGRDALAHGDERLAKPGFGYLFRVEGTKVVLYGKAKWDLKARRDELDVADLRHAVDELEAWLDRESS
jgi:hypothetical protein